ncbi:MAG: ATP-binding protein, partial [Terriglobia bacterium]
MQTGVTKLPEHILMSWSGGKDSARALYEIQQRGEYSVAALLSTVTEGYDRVCMHGVRRELLERQAEAIGLPLEKIYIPKDATNGEYEARMRAVLERYRREGMVSVAFG